MGGGGSEHEASSLPTVHNVPCDVYTPPSVGPMSCSSLALQAAAPLFPSSFPSGGSSALPSSLAMYFDDTRVEALISVYDEAAITSPAAGGGRKRRR